MTRMPNHDRSDPSVERNALVALGQSPCDAHDATSVS